MINLAQKVGQKFVNSVFSQVYGNYDRANDLMSCFLHRKWKKDFVEMLPVKNGDAVLDIACGSGDICKLLLQKTNSIVGCDISEEMLGIARKKVGGVEFQVQDASNLEFKNEEFDLITCVFGIRNFEQVEKSIDEAFRVLKKNGMFAIMEFLPNANGRVFNVGYQSYVKHVLPKFDFIFKNDANSYAYFSKSILEFQTRQHFTKLLESKGFKVVTPSFANGSVGVFLCVKR